MAEKKYTVLTVSLVALSIALFSQLLMTCATPMVENRPVTVKILHTNDHHSHLEGTAYTLEFDGVATRLNMGGFARIITLIEQLRDKSTIVLNSGELNGTAYFSIFKGEVDFRLFNQLGLDAYALGNHEFDEGDGRLAELIEMANFPIVSSNAAPTGESPLYSVRDSIKPAVIKEIDGQQIGIIGVLKVEKTKNSSMVSDDVAFTAEIEAVRAQVAELEARGINKIILLSHVGYYNDIVFAREIAGLDVIVGGDTHSLLGDAQELQNIGLGQKYYGQTGPFPGYSHDSISAENIPSLGQYPTVINGADGNPVQIVTAWEYAYGLGSLEVEFDAAGKVVATAGNIIIPLEGPYLQQNGSDWQPVGEQAATAIDAVIDRSPILTTAKPAESALALLEPYREALEAAKEETIGVISQTMPFERIPVPFAAGATPSGSYAAFIVADAFRTMTPNIDIAIQNAGGVRTQFLAGDFKVNDAITALPFSNTVTILQLSGAEVIKALNEAAYYSLNTGSTGAFPYASGIRYDVDLNGAADSIIYNVEIGDGAGGNWSALDMQAVYRVCTNSFIAQGKDNYLTFKEVRDRDATLFEDTYINYFIPLKEYIQSQTDNTLPPLDSNAYCLKSVR